jgi:hypothetical protein
MNGVMKRILSLLVVVGPATAHADKIFDSGTGATWDCAKGDEVVINTSNGAYTFKGTCKDINVNGSALKISIESIEDLTINGSKNTVTIGAVADLAVNGGNNVITYGKGFDGKKPDIASNGVGNTIKAGTVASATASATGAGTTTTTTTTVMTAAAPASDATILDCTKKKTVAITKGKGNYRLTGTCDKVSISGGDNNVAIDAAKNLAVTGSRNQVHVDKADKIAVTGGGNSVTYGAGLTLAAPKTATTGKNNTITGVASATASVTGAGGTVTASTTTTATTATATTTAATAGAIDCNKTPTHTLDDNNGTFVFAGKCELITVSGNNITVKAESAKAIYVAGNNNTIDATAVDSLATPGNHNTARWKKGVSGAKAKVSNPGNHNKVTQVK